MSNISTAVEVKSYCLESFGIENLVVKETAQLPLQPGQVRVKLHAASLNYRDLLLVKGHYDPKVLSSAPLIPLSDAAGEIVEIATDVSRFKIGDKVASIFFQKWLDGECSQELTKSALGGAVSGVLTNYKIFDQQSLVHLPKGFSYEEGATLPCAAVTAWHALIVANKLKAGETVLIQGTGGVSIFALQFAKISGAKVILTSSSDEKLAKAKKLGADFLINYKQTPEWETEVRKITNGMGVDHIIEVGGAQTITKSFKALRFGGKIALIGILSGTEGSINLLPILMKSLLVQGIYVGSRAMFESMNKAIETNKLRPIIDKVFNFNEAKQALYYLEKASHFGKVIIKID
jgi:NADPH:quinone reductase-like Zn-dependent oxidoreductase